MIKVRDSQEFNSVIKAFRNANPKALSNCFLMPAEVDDLASAGKISLSEYPGWLFILCDREGYSNLYYYTTDNSDVGYASEFMKTVSDREVYLDIVTRNGRGDNVTSERLAEAGLADKYKSYQRMQLAVKDIDFESLSVNLAEGYSMTADYCDAEEIHMLWKAALDEKSTPLPDENELKLLCENGCLLSVVDSDGNLAGVLVLSVASKQVLIQHLAVSPDHRRKGIAFSLLNKSFIIAKEKELTLLRLWVDRVNYSAIALYDRTGFTVDGMICDQLYMKGN